jgi:hypothetical protein
MEDRVATFAGVTPSSQILTKVRLFGEECDELWANSQAEDRHGVVDLFDLGFEEPPLLLQTEQLAFQAGLEYFQHAPEPDLARRVRPPVVI